MSESVNLGEMGGLRSRPMTTQRTMDDWTPAMSQAATAEGWDLFETHGSRYGSPQIQSLDDSGKLDDDEAWQLARIGTATHHVTAREILRFENPHEYKALMEVGQVDPYADEDD